MIDKQYIMGYEISNRGKIETETNKEWLKDQAAKNIIVDNIFDVILDPKNQINLTMPVTTDNIQKIAAKSVLGRDGLVMNPYNSASKYLMQIQNMVGKKVIGNVATAIKSFFALSNIYNEQFRRIFDFIESGNYESAKELLNRYTFYVTKVDGTRQLITLANVNLDIFDKYLTPDGKIDRNLIQDSTICDILDKVISFEDALDDQSLMLGELLNVATDERHFRKIIK